MLWQQEKLIHLSSESLIIMVMIRTNACVCMGGGYMHSLQIISLLYNSSADNTFIIYLFKVNFFLHCIVLLLYSQTLGISGTNC